MPRGAPTMVLVVLSLLGANVPGCCESLTQDEDYNYTDGCHPEEADTCFKDVNDNLLCNLGKPIPNKNCTGRNAYDLCESMSDALDCCEDIMDTCEESDGLDIFQVWFTGLDSVYSYLCMGNDDLALITDLLEGSNCFRLKKFITCVEDRANLTHVADLLTTRLDLRECNMIQVSVAACIEDAEKNKRTCRGRADAVKEALIVFFSSTACGLPLPQSLTTPLPVPCIPPTTDTSTAGLDNATTTTNNKTGSKVSNDTENSSTKVTTIPNQASTSRDTSTSTTNIPAVCQTTQDLGKRGTPTASTIVVTVLVTVVLVGLAGMVLVKRGVLTIKTDFDRRLAGFNDGDSSSGYDRF